MIRYAETYGLLNVVGQIAVGVNAQQNYFTNDKSDIALTHYNGSVIRLASRRGIVCYV
jgi:hypothetical protein